jgi:outer membrane biogenesis lipoprotein LolB
MKHAAMGMLALALLAGCAGTTKVPPAAQLAPAQSAVRTAAELSDEGTPRAELHVRLAQEQLETARSLVSQGKGEEAQMLLLAAIADAELAVALAREHRAKAEARRVIDEVQAMQQELH